MSSTSNYTIYKSSSVVELFKRIHRSQIQKEQNKRFTRFVYSSIFLLFLVSIFCLFQCHNRVYNAWIGPFHLNLDEFNTHWKIYSENVSIEKSLLSNLFSFDKEYLQIELGEDKIENNTKDILGVYYRHPIYKKLLYTFNPIKEQSIVNIPMKLFIKLPTNLQSHFHKRLPYRFELFNSDTIKCIVQQIGISPKVYHSSFEKSMYIQMIEKIYDQNATNFNMKVITKCGILLGYLYDCATETVFTGYSNQPYTFTFSAAAFDASTSYSPSMTYLFGSLLLLWYIERIFAIFLDLLRFLLHIINRGQPVISLDVQDTLNRFNINSIQMLDRLLMGTLKEYNYHNRLFLIEGRHLIIFKISLNERDPEVLRQFYMETPFIIINITHITEINSDDISISNGYYSNKILLPKINNNDNNNMVNWLHERLMNCSTNYRHCYEQEKLRQQQEAIRIQEKQRRDLLAALISEEVKIQRVSYENDFERILNRTTSASPRFIAQFRFDGPQIFNIQLSEITCAICLETFKSGDYYSQWPCIARHPFHYKCMLGVLRRQNQCPLCRHPVEAADLPSIDILFRNFLNT